MATTVAEKAHRPNPASGCTGDVIIEIGGIAVLLRSSDRAFRQMLTDRYAGFVKAEARADFVFDVELTEPAAAADDDDVRVSREGSEWRVERGDFSAGWSALARRGWIRQSANPYSADTLLRIVHSIALAEKGGFLLHAASAVRNGGAFLFAGVSGAGKTTLTRCAPLGTRILTDEISYVVKNAEGYRACGTPFAGELARVGENISAPVAGLFFLAKANGNELKDMGGTRAVSALLRNTVFLAQDETLVHRVFESAMQFVTEVPTRVMEFTPDARAWEMIQ